MTTSITHGHQPSLGRRLAAAGALIKVGLALLVSLGATGCIGGVTIGSDGEVTPLSPLDIIGSLTGASSGCEGEGEPSDSIRKQMFDNLNAYRTQNGLSTLRYSLTLEAAANAHAQDMYERSFFDHTNPDGDGPYERARAQGYCLASVGENIALTSDDDPMAVQLGWQGSPGHDANMRYETWEYTGMGHYEVPGGSTSGILAGAHYWVQLFAGPAMGSS